MHRISLLLMTGLLLFWGMAAYAGEAKILVEKGNFDFGEIFEGQKVEHIFRFQNAGDEPLIIDRVRSSCGCWWPVRLCSAHRACLWPGRAMRPSSSGSMAAPGVPARRACR